MNTNKFWMVIGTYNSQTKYFQIVLLVLLFICTLLVLIKHTLLYFEFFLSVTNLFIGIVFFGVFGTEPIQKYFALPLFIIIGLLFLYESVFNSSDLKMKFNIKQVVLIFLYMLYPVFSYLFGHKFPEIVTHIMPCPIITFSIALYSAFNKKSIPIYILLIVWGLTGIKSILFNAYEDIIFLLAGIYCLFEGTSKN